MEFEELTPQPATAPKQAIVHAEGSQEKEAFQPIQYMGQSISLPASKYRVYTTKSDYVEIKAASAYEAMQLTNIRQPYKIIRHSINRVPVISQDMLRGLDENDATPNNAETIEAETAIEVIEAPTISDQAATTEAAEVAENVVDAPEAVEVSETKAEIAAEEVVAEEVAVETQEVQAAKVEEPVILPSEDEAAERELSEDELDALLKPEA